MGAEDNRDMEEVPFLFQHEKGKRKRLILIAAFALAAVVLFMAFFWYRSSGRSEEQRYVTKEAVRGDLSVTVTATGTLQPVTKVDISSELSGIVSRVNVDFNDKVKAGDELARLDTTALESQVIKARAALNSARAKLSEAKTTFKESESRLNQLKRSWDMSGGKVPSQGELDTAQASFDRASAAVVTAEALIEEARANLSLNETSLSKTIIRSPIDGVVLKREVEPGQTVASSLQAPVLFIIAENLIQMELHVYVDEADVGQIQEGQEATFTVDAYPGRIYEAEITEVRFTPTESEGVVTYETVLSVDNSDLSLRPGMTATAEVITQHVESALLVPNAALRFRPQQLRQNNGDGSIIDKLIPRRRRWRGAPEQRRKDSSRVWVETGNKDEPLRAIEIGTGPTDGRMTVVLEGQIEPGQALVIAVEKSGK